MDKGYNTLHKKGNNSNASQLSNQENGDLGNSMLPPALAIESSKPEQEEEKKEEQLTEEKQEVEKVSTEEIQEVENKTSEDTETATPTKEYAGDDGPSDNNNSGNNGNSNNFQLNNSGNNNSVKGLAPFNFQQTDDKVKKEATEKSNYEFGGGDGAGSGTSGNGLPNEVNNKMESAFNADFSDVKVHKNSQKSKDIGAYAFTQGNAVHFAPGHFQPYSPKGQELIGHELSHVVQQSEQDIKPTKKVNGVGINDNKKLEQEADNTGKKAANKKGKTSKPKKKPKPKKATAQSKEEVIQRAAAPASILNGLVPAFTLFDDVLDIDIENIGGSTTLLLNLNIAPLLTAVKAEITIDQGAFVSGKLIVKSGHLPGTELVLNVDSNGVVDPILSIEETTLIFGLQASVSAEVNLEGIVGTITVALPEAKQITDTIKATSGSVSFDLGAGGEFTGTVQVESNDGYVSGSASVAVNYETGNWSGVATVTSNQSKQLSISEGIDIVLPAGMELTITFGSEGVDVTGNAEAEITVELKTADGVDLEGLAVLNIGLGLMTSGISIDTLSIDTTTTYKEIQAEVSASLTEGEFAGNISLTLQEPKAISDSITAESGNLIYTFGEGGFFAGTLQVNTNDGFAVGSADVTFDQATNAWAGTATVSSQEDKTINLLPNTNILLPSGMELTISFGPEGTQIQGSANVQLDVALNTTDGLQLNSVSVLNIELGIDNSGISIIGLTIDSTTTIFDMQAKVNGTMTEDGFVGTVTIDLLEPKAITDTLTAESGSISYSFGTGGAFTGNLQVKTNDGFATGTAAVEYNPMNSVWSGVATVASQQPKEFTIAGGIVLNLPAGMELTVSFGPDGTQLEGSANAQINIDLATTDGLELTQVATADIQLGISNSGINIISIAIDSTTTVFGMEARVIANINESGISGSVNIELMEPKVIGNFLTILSGSLSYDFGIEGGFEGQVAVVTNDGFAEGTASVSFDPQTDNWSGVATVTSIASKFIEVTPGVSIELPAGIEFSIGFGSGEIDIDGLANVLVHIDLNTGSGINVSGEAEVVVRFDNSGITIVSVYLTSTTTILGLDAQIEVTIDEEGLKGTVNLELTEPLVISDYLVADAGSFSFDIGTTGLITGELHVSTTDGFAAGTAAITIDPGTHSWTGIATVNTLTTKELEIATGVKLILPAGAEMVIEFGSEGIAVQATANIIAEVELVADSGVQASGLADLDVTFGTEGISIAPNIIALAVTGGLTTPDIDAIVEDGHLTTDVDNGAVLTLVFGDSGSLTRVDLEATGGFSNEEKRIGRISFAGQVNLNPFTFNGVLHAVSQTELDILGGDRFNIVLVAGSQFFVYLDDEGISNIDASLAADLKEGEEAIARLKMIGMLPRGEGLSLMATIELLKSLEIIAPTENSLGVSLEAGASLGATIEGGALTQIEGTLGLGVYDMEGGLFSGELSGIVDISQPDQNLSVESGSGTLTLLRDYVMELSAGDITIASGAYFSASFGDGTLTGISGLVSAAYDDGDNVISITAEIDYDTVNKNIRSLDALLETDAEFFLFNDALKISELSGSISIRNNQLISIGGHVRLDAEIGEFILAGEADIAWLSSEEGNMFVGSGWLEFNWSEGGENPDKFFNGRVDASINGDEFALLGQIEMGLMKGLTGSASIFIDQEMDPVISASLTYTATLMEADELWAFEESFGITFPVFPGISIGAGIMFGIGISTRPLIVMGTAGISDWRPKSNEFPTFDAMLQASWGIDIEAKALAYLELVLGIDNVLYFAAGIRAGVGLNIPIEIMPWIALHGSDEGIWGELGLKLSINPILKLIVEAYMEWGVLGIWDGDKVWGLVDQELGSLGSLNWEGSFAFGDKDESSQDAPQMPEQVVAPTGTPTLETGDKPADLGIGNQENEPDAEGGLSNLTDGLMSPTQEGEEPETEGMGSELEKVATYAQGIGAVGELLGIIMDGFKWFMSGGPVGLILWMIFEKPPKSEINALKAEIAAFRQQLAGEEYIETGSTIDKVLGVLSGEYSFWVVVDNNMPFRKLIEDGKHKEATIADRAVICDELLDGITWDKAEQAMLDVVDWTFHNEGQGAVRELVEKSGGRDRWNDNFQNDIWGRDEQDELDWYLDQCYGGHHVYDVDHLATYTAEPGAYIERKGRSWEQLAKTAFGDESYAMYLLAYDQNPNPNAYNAHIPTLGEIPEIALTTLDQRFALPTTLEYAHQHETFEFIATHAYGDPQLAGKLATINVLAIEHDIQQVVLISFFPFEIEYETVTIMKKGSTIVLPTPEELGPPWIEVAPMPIGNTGYNVWVEPGPNLQSPPVMWAGSPDQRVIDIAAQAKQTDLGQDAGAELETTATFIMGEVSQLTATNAVTKAAGLIEFLLTSELFSFEEDTGGGGPTDPLAGVQPGDMIEQGDLEMETIAGRVYGHEGRAAWIEAHQPPGASNTPASEVAAVQGLAFDAQVAIDMTKTVGQNIAKQAPTKDQTSTQKTATPSKGTATDSSSSGGGNSEPLPPGMIDLPTWQEMHDLDTLPVNERGIAPDSTIEANSSDTWSSLALIVYDDWEKALALSDHSSNTDTVLSAGAHITLPSATDLSSHTVEIAQVEAEKLGPAISIDGSGKGDPISSGVSVSDVPATTDGTETEEPRVVAPGTVIKAIAGDTWSGLALEAYDDFTLFPRLVNHPANALVKTLPPGEWITIPTLEQLMNTEEFGLGMSPNGFPLLTEMVRVPSAEELHHVWVEDRSGASSPTSQTETEVGKTGGNTSPVDQAGVWVMASNPFDLAPEVDKIVEETQDDPVLNPHALELQNMTQGEQTTAAIDSTKADIIALTDAKLLAEEAEPESTELVIEGVPQAFVDHLKLREGFETEVYKDSEGKLTVGLGHLLVGDELTTYKEGDTVPMSKLTEWANTNVKHAYNGAKNQASTLGVTGETFIIALASVCFQLGNAWNTIHKKTWGFMLNKEWEKAAVEAADSSWNTQTPVRVQDFQTALRALITTDGQNETGTIPKADLSRNVNNLADNRWIDDGVPTEYAEAFNLIIDSHVQAVFKEPDVTRDEIVNRICEADAEECTEDADLMRAKLFQANQYAILEVLDVENNDKYAPGDGKTYCNVYAYDVVTALGGYLPRVWWNDSAIARINNGETVTAVYGETVHEMTANMLNTWIRAYGDDFGWRQEQNMQSAQAEANNGKIAIILASNVVASKSGHVAVILSETDQLEANGDLPLISQAGATNVEHGAATSKWWENANHKDGSAWVFEGPIDSPIMTPDQVGGNMTNTVADNANATDTGTNTTLEPTLTASVGQGGVNNSADVMLVQNLLTLANQDPGPIDGICGLKTIAAIRAFQQANFSWNPDGLISVDEVTWQKLVTYNPSSDTSNTNTTSDGTDNSDGSNNDNTDGKLINQRGIVTYKDNNLEDGETKLRVRSEPDTGLDNVLEELDFGSIVQVISEPNSPPGWYYVVTECGTVGYSAKFHFWTNLPEENPILYKVESGETVLGIVNRELDTYNIDGRTLVNIVAHMNSSITVGDNVSGWQDASVDAGDMIYLPSLQYANDMKGAVNSGSISGEALEALSEFANLGAFLGIGGELPSDPKEVLSFFLTHIGSLLEYIPGIGQIIDVLDKLNAIWNFFDTLIDMKDDIIQAIKDKIEEEIAKVEDKARAELTKQGVPESHIEGVMNHLEPMIAKLKEEWWQMVKEGIWDMIWPIPKVWEEVKNIFNNLLVAGNHIWNFEFSKFVDSVLDIWGNVNAAIGTLEGWISIALIATPTIAGAMAGGVGAIPGFAAGVAAAETFGLVLLASTVAEHIAKIVKSLLSLHPIGEAEDDDEKALSNHVYYAEIAGSSLALVILGGMVVVAAIGTHIGKTIYRAVKARYTKPPVITITGKSIAASKGWPDAPEGFFWRKQGDDHAILVRKSAADSPRLTYNEAKGKFVATDRPDLVYDPDSTLFIDADNVSYKYESGDFVQVASASGLAVDTVIGGRTVARVRTGNDKVVLIGTDMNGIFAAADQLIAEGKFVEVLGDNYLQGKKWTIDGKEWNVNSAWDDMVNNPVWDPYRYTSGPNNGRIKDEFIPLTPMYKLNKKWIDDVNAGGSTILDLGNPSGSSSIFYIMEGNAVTWNTNGKKIN